MRLVLLLLTTGLAAACGGGTSPGTDAPAEEGATPIAFGFVVLADPHLYGSPDAEQRLEAAATWIAERSDAGGIELVLVVGDLGSRRDRVQAILSGLPVPWIPVLGDNAVQAGEEQAYHDELEGHYASLAGRLDDWRKAPAPVDNPQVRAESFLQNLAFTHRGVRFVGLDWCTREHGTEVGEQADLHDFEGGTFRWLAEEAGRWDTASKENVVLFSHHPMHDFALGLASFSPIEIARIEALLEGARERVYANFAGHYHVNMHETRERGGYEIFVTDATHDDDNTLRWVRVHKDDDTWSYEHELVVLPSAP